MRGANGRSGMRSPGADPESSTMHCSGFRVGAEEACPGITDSYEENYMDYRSLGRSGLKISPICLGTMMFGGATDQPSSPRIAAKGREAGINLIATAEDNKR